MNSPPHRISIRDEMVATTTGLPFFDAVNRLGISAIELQIDPGLTTPNMHRQTAIVSAWQPMPESKC